MCMEERIYIMYVCSCVYAWRRTRSRAMRQHYLTFVHPYTSMHTRQTQLVVKANATALFVFIEGASLTKKAIVTI